LNVQNRKKYETWFLLYFTSTSLVSESIFEAQPRAESLIYWSLCEFEISSSFSGPVLSWEGAKWSPQFLRSGDQTTPKFWADKESSCYA